jgi:hypothetical protein
MTPTRREYDALSSTPDIETDSDPSPRPAGPTRWHVGNAVRESAHRRGWFVGPFLDPDAGIRATSELEIKWAQPLANDRRSEVMVNEQRTTVVILVKGRCQIELSAGSFVLSAPGDYAAWGPGIDHSWEALQDSTLITVRWWPSTPAPDPAPSCTEEPEPPQAERRAGNEN